MSEPIKSSGQPVDLLAALQQSIDAAKVSRRDGRGCMERTGCHDYKHGTDCPMHDWERSLEAGRPL